LFGLLDRARRARPRQAGWVRSLSLSLAYCAEVAGIVLIGLAAAATVASVVQLSTVGVVTIGGSVPRGSFVDVALSVATWLMVWGLPLGIVLLGVAVLEWGLLGRWSALPLAVGLLMNPLLGLFLFYLLALVKGADISVWDIMTVPTFWPNWSGFYTYVVPNAIIGASWMLLGWVIWSSRDESLASGAERTSL
jgi:hypothetical protein